MRENRKWPALLTVIIAGGILIGLVLVGRFLGVADNGDFARMMNTVGLNYYAEESYSDRFFHYSHSRFAYDRIFSGFYPSSQILVILLPRLLFWPFQTHYFDIRLVGVVYSLLLTTATWILVREASKRSALTGLLTGAALLFVFYDIGYTAYFNSLFGEPVSMTFLLLTFAFGIRLTAAERPSNFNLSMFFISACMMIASKIQNAPLGLAFALIFLRIIGLKSKDKGWKKRCLVFAVSTLALSVILYAGAPKELKRINIYQTVFFGVLNGSDNIKGDLHDLGLPEKLSVLAGTNYFQTDTVIKQDDPSLNADFYNRISHGDIALFYIKHPHRLYENMKYAANNAFSIRPYYLGNYEKGEGKTSGSVSYLYSGWSEFKNGYVPHTIMFLGVFYLLYCAIWVWEYIRTSSIKYRTALELMALLGLIGLFSFLVPILGDGRADIGKHLFLFNVSFDLMMLAILIWLVHKFQAWFRLR
ncbi:glycan biosynthesis hexose transferase WsfD [Paenibacillus glufosinatiresistens]|uniref:glycan biosynthesis hexose transferase WsfD n=1 Tax=Paenibacillus glufosinatiresistens TaxID=3070657 RepID=UPI00286E3274|nr:hypothetical protein [Paenibacillus sp. YX.27]